MQYTIKKEEQYNGHIQKGQNISGRTLTSIIVQYTFIVRMAIISMERILSIIPMNV